MNKLMETVGLRSLYDVECRDKNGNLKWREVFYNLVTTAGLNAVLNRTFHTVGGDADWYVGLKGTGSMAAGDTAASHAGWSELTDYTEANRQAWTPNAASTAASLSNSAARASFSINATVTIYGAFLIDENTKGGSTGVLYGGGNFASPRAAEDGDTLNVRIDLTAASV